MVNWANTPSLEDRPTTGSTVADRTGVAEGVSTPTEQPEVPASTMAIDHGREEPDS